MGLHVRYLRIVLPALIVSFGGSFQCGFQTVLMNPSEETFSKFINTSYQSHFGSYLTSGQYAYLWPFMLSSQMLGAAIGTLFARSLLDKFGRKKSLYLTSAGFLLGSILQAVSKSMNAWEVLLGGRFLHGIVQGVQSGLQPVYFNEISPKSIRGAIGSMTGLVVELGYFFATILSLPIILGDEKHWPFLFLVEIVPTLLCLTALPFLSESPKYLASKGDFDAAQRSLRFYGRTEIETKSEIDEIHRELAKSVENSKISFKEFFSTPYIRKGVFLGWMIAFSGSYSGAHTLACFSTILLQNAGLSPFISQLSTTGMSAPLVLGAFIGGALLDRFGRRPIMLTVTASFLPFNALFIIFGHLARVYSLQWAAYANIAVSAAILFLYGIGPGIMIYMLTAELVPQKARSLAQSLVMLAQWICLGTAPLIFYPLKEALDEFSFLLHIVPLILALVYFSLALPETKNKSTIEIMRQLGYQENSHQLEMEKQPAEEDEQMKLTKKF